MSRLLKFLRSVLPADPTQLIFLCGIVCLIAGAHMRWWPASTVSDLSEQSRQSLGIFVMLARFPILFAVAAGYFLCFWPVQRPLLYIWLWVSVPALASVGLICGRFLYFLQAPQTSVLDRSPWLPQNLHSGFAALWSLGLGFRFTLIGLLLIAVYMSRLAFGISNLPMALPMASLTPSHDDTVWHPTRRLIWFLLAWFYVVMNLTYEIVMTGLETVVTHLAHRPPGPWANHVSASVGALALVVVAILLIGASGLQEVQRTVSWCRPRYLVLGALFAFGVSALISMGQYAADRVAWAVHSFGISEVPEFTTYFKVPGAALLLLFVPALCEEIIFRVLLQRRLVDRYGLYRGLFLVGVVWSAFHFYHDFSEHIATQDMLLQLASRIFNCVTLSCVLGWLTLRAGSVFPAAIAHTAFNILVYSDFGQPFPGKATLRNALWGALAYALFRYWPPETSDAHDLIAAKPILDPPQLEPE